MRATDLRQAFSILTATALLANGGCASLTYSDAHHVRHVIGLVNMSLTPSDATSVEQIKMTTFGVAIRFGGFSGSQVMLGYGMDTIIDIPLSGACLDLQRPGPCSSMAKTYPVLMELEKTP